MMPPKIPLFLSGVLTPRIPVLLLSDSHTLHSHHPSHEAPGAPPSQSLILVLFSFQVSKQKRRTKRSFQGKMKSTPESNLSSIQSTIICRPLVCQNCLMLLQAGPSPRMNESSTTPEGVSTLRAEEFSLPGERSESSCIIPSGQEDFEQPDGLQQKQKNLNGLQSTGFQNCMTDKLQMPMFTTNGC